MDFEYERGLMHSSVHKVLNTFQNCIAKQLKHIKSYSFLQSKVCLFINVLHIKISSSLSNSHISRI